MGENDLELRQGDATPVVAACPVCGGSFDDNGETVACVTCRTPHHRHCWDFNKGCATYGCGSVSCEVCELDELMDVESAAPPCFHQSLLADVDGCLRILMLCAFGIAVIVTIGFSLGLDAAARYLPFVLLAGLWIHILPNPFLTRRVTFDPETKRLCRQWLFFGRPIGLQPEPWLHRDDITDFIYLEPPNGALDAFITGHRLAVVDGAGRRHVVHTVVTLGSSEAMRAIFHGQAQATRRFLELA